jgi:hypothetical protein
VNLDPRRRVAAALGARVVRGHQEEIVAAAWEQAGDAAEVNRLLDRAAAARTTTQLLFERHVAQLDEAALWHATAPLAPRVRVGAQTLHAALRDTDLPPAAVTATFARLTRPRGPLMRRALRTAARRGAAAADAASPAERAWRISGAESLHAPRGASATADVPPALALRQLRALLLDALEPEQTVAMRMRSRVRLPEQSQEGRAGLRAAATEQGPAPDPVAPASLPVAFPVPTYGALAAVAPDVVLPGADALPADSVSLLETNRAFVAAFLVGLNTELARELVWRGFPVDRRATFFRHFWDFRGRAEWTPDVEPIDRWHAAAQLEDVVAAASSALVLAVRGELLRRYPRTLVYALPARWSPDGEPELGDDNDSTRRESMFEGWLPPDIRFFGFAPFDGGMKSGEHGPGWFFVFQEHATEARFEPLPEAPWPATWTAADIAAQAHRPALRIAIHADELLP